MNKNPVYWAMIFFGILYPEYVIFLNQAFHTPFPSADGCCAGGGRAGAGWAGRPGLVRLGIPTWVFGLARTGRRLAPDWG